MFPNLYLYFRNHHYVFNHQHDFQFILPLEIFLTVSLSMSDHICLHIVFMHNRKHLLCIIRYPLVSMVKVSSPTSWAVAVCKCTNEEVLIVNNDTCHEHCCQPYN